jgi:sporulation protein YqfD
MISLQLTRWLIGYVRFSVLGGNPERFYSLSAHSGAVLWNISACSKSGACVAARRYRSLRSCARRAGCRLRVRGRRGLPFLLRRTRGKEGLWAGAALFFAIVCLLSLRIWCIQITGNSSVPVSRIAAELRSAGLSPGTPKRDVDPRLLAQRIMLKIPEIRWMSINTQGCTVQVAVQEKTAQPEVKESSGICNIKASATGQIVSMKVYSGTPLVHKGDAVAEGRLLVSAVVEDKAGGSTLRHASAEIIAQTSRTLTVSVVLDRHRTVTTGRTAVRRNFDLFGVKIPVTLQTRPRGIYRCSCEQCSFQLFGTVLPIGIYTEHWEEIRDEKYRLSKQQALRAAEKEVRRQAAIRLPGAKIISSQPSPKWEKNSLLFTANLVCEENIAKESEISIK